MTLLALETQELFSQHNVAELIEVFRFMLISLWGASIIHSNLSSLLVCGISPREKVRRQGRSWIIDPQALHHWIGAQSCD
jgi:hypothetical protein